MKHPSTPEGFANYAWEASIMLRRARLRLGCEHQATRDEINRVLLRCPCGIFSPLRDGDAVGKPAPKPKRRAGKKGKKR